MKAFTEKLLHYLTLVGVTLIAIWVIWIMMSSKSKPTGKQEHLLRPLSEVARSKAPVVVKSVEVQLHDILATYSGKIHPWETHKVSFEVAGRVQQLGTFSTQEPDRGGHLDEGDVVVAGQVLASLDDRVFRALKSEASAQVKQAESDLQRAQDIRVTNRSALSDSELQSRATELTLAHARLEVAIKNLEDATLTSPVNATISRRLINPGESIGANQMAFELVENEDVLLIVEVPESQVRELENRNREVRALRVAAKNNSPQHTLDREDAVFRAYVNLKGHDRQGNPWPALVGDVYRISEVADPRTSLFQVEIRLPNQDKSLRPGMIATAHIVLARIHAYKLPEIAVIFRKQKAYLFSAEKQSTEMEMMYWNVGPTDIYRAKRIELSSWIEQGQSILIPRESESLHPSANSSLPKEDPLENLHWVVIRGQHRLADSQLVRIMDPRSLKNLTLSSLAPNSSTPNKSSTNTLATGTPAIGNSASDTPSALANDH
ncbi:MAG: efflux RND transporter periplasmic adaptor subunit [Pirellulales bacterium]